MGERRLSEDEILKAYAALERRYDGPIPAEALEGLRFGSALEAEVAKIEVSIAFFREQIVEMRQSAKRWFHRGNLEMARRNIEDSRLYLGEWRVLRRRIAVLRPELGARKSARAERAQLLNAKRVLDLIRQAAE